MLLVVRLVLIFRSQPNSNGITLGISKRLELFNERPRRRAQENDMIQCHIPIFPDHAR